MIYVSCIIMGMAMVVCEDRTVTFPGWVLLVMGSVLLGGAL